MPRVSGVSFSSTVWRIRRRPSPLTTVACFRSNPVGLTSSVTLTVLPFVSVRSFAILLLEFLRAGFRQLVERLAPQPRDPVGILERPQPRERRTDDVVGVRRPERLRQ